MGGAPESIDSCQRTIPRWNDMLSEALNPMIEIQYSFSALQILRVVQRSA